MIIVQSPWSLSTEKTLAATIAAARRTLVGAGPQLVLLPHGDGSESEAVSEKAMTVMLGRLAKTGGTYICASAYVRVDGEAAPRTVGLLVDDAGTVLLRTAKILPDMVEGFTDTMAETYQPADFKTARTPFGQIGILCGEDVLAPHIFRATVTAGAEVILNPARERGDQHLAMRLQARQARAYENLAYVVTASATHVTRDGFTVKLPPASLAAEWWGTKVAAGGEESFFTADIDIAMLRRRRQEPMGNYPAVVRMPLYGPGYKTAAGKARPAPSTRKDWIAAGEKLVAAQARQAASDKQQYDRFDVALAQCLTYSPLKPDDLLECRSKNLENAIRLITYSAKPPNTRLVVFPEFFLTGPTSTLGSNSSHIAHLIGVSFPGPEADRLAKFAQDMKVYVAGGVFEFDPDWPGRFFNTAFIFDDNGNLIHRYRKIHCGDVFGMLPDTTPGSLYDKYVDKYGYESLFPVADTPLGRIATKICFDMNFPETARGMVSRGAEIIIHPTSEPHNIRRRGWDIARHVRAFENTAYVLTAGHGGEYSARGGGELTFFNRGYSKVVNYDGTLQAIVDGPGASPLVGSLDMKALRRARADMKNNLVLWDDTVVYEGAYNAGAGMPNNLWAGDPAVNPYEKAAELKKVIAGYNAKGIYVPPEAKSAA